MFTIYEPTASEALEHGFEIVSAENVQYKTVGGKELVLLKYRYKAAESANTEAVYTGYFLCDEMPGAFFGSCIDVYYQYTGKGNIIDLEWETVNPPESMKYCCKPREQLKGFTLDVKYSSRYPEYKKFHCTRL